jgi:hypothetical protein
LEANEPCLAVFSEPRFCRSAGHASFLILRTKGPL